MSSAPERVGSVMAARSATTAAASAIAVLAVALLDPGRFAVVTAQVAPAAARAACPVPTRRELRLRLSATTAASGNRLTASAALGVVAEDGAVIGPRTDRVDIWWDLDFGRWWSALTGRPAAIGGGQSRRVASVAASGACTFSASFAVPETKPGPHVVVAIAFDRRDDGATAYAPAYVTVLSTSRSRAAPRRAAPRRPLSY